VLVSEAARPVQFMCFIALNSVAPMSLEAIADRYVQRFPTLARKYPITGSAAAPGESPNFISLGRKQFAILHVGQALPAVVWEFPLTQNLVWAGAAEAIAGHRAHIVVSATERISGLVEVIAQARRVTALAAVLASLGDTAAVIWNEGRVIHEPGTFLAMATALDNGPPPPQLWTGMLFGQGKPGLPLVRTFGVMTTGLVPFFGYEIEFEPAAVPMMTIAERLLGTLQYLFAQGPVLKDGETLGISNTERIRIARLPETVRPGIPVMKLTIEKLG
jgi:hypothetical protein